MNDVAQEMCIYNLNMFIKHPSELQSFRTSRLPEAAAAILLLYNCDNLAVLIWD